MKTTQQHSAVQYALIVALFGVLGAMNSLAQFTFTSGSTGTNGALDVTTGTNTVVLPPHGQLHYTTVNIASNATLRFIANSNNTPVYLLATGDVIVNGTIDMSGKPGTSTNGGAGGPGGFAGGNPRILVPFRPAGDGYGPGAGKAGTNDSVNQSSAGHGSYRTVSTQVSTNHGAAYGSPLLIPLVGGSGAGGGPNRGGNGGGGAILIASSTSVLVTGSILAGDGASGDYKDGRGSGGAIRLLAPVVSGSGVLRVIGANITSSGESQSPASGRIRIDCMLCGSLGFNFQPSLSAASIGANMVVFPPMRLDITQAASNSIPVGTSGPVFFILPQDSSTNQTVTVQASNFGVPVPIRVVLTPDNGPSSSYDVQIDNSTVNPASTNVNVVVPVNVRVQVNAWTR